MPEKRDRVQLQSGLSALNAELHLEDPPARAGTTYLPINATLLGTINRPMSRTRGTIVPSKLQKFFPEGGSSYFAPAEAEEHKGEDGSFKGPLHKLAEAVPLEMSVDPAAFGKAMEDLELDMEVYKSALSGVTPLSLNQAINGVPGVMKGINKDTAAGFPYSGKLKSDFLIARSSGEDPKYDLDEAILADVHDFAENPREYFPIVEAKKKMEIRPIEKRFNTRWFTVFPMFFLILFRIFISYVLIVWRSRMHIAETLIGCNAAGRDWNVLGTSLDDDRPGEWVYMGFDFSMYDKRFRALLKVVAYTYISGLLSLTSYDYDQLKVCSYLMWSLVNVFLVINNEVFFINDWQHSGDPVTVEVNTIGQRFLYRYWYYKMCPDAAVGTFRDNVTLWAYGDDTLARVRKIPGLTQLTFARTCEDWGMKVTSATKGELTEYMERDDLTFLKRGIVYDEDFGGYRAPLEERSIFKMLCWFDTTSAITEERWIEAVVENAAREWFLHGRLKFAAETKRLQACMEELGLVYSGKGWDTYMEMYKTSEFTTWDL